MSTTVDKIRKQIEDNDILLYMKGTPEKPECGFSARATEAIKATGVSFAYVNVLASPFIRERLPQVSNWPTFPQLFVNGELVGGCDIICEMAEQGELTTCLQAAR